jgi:lysophospholipase L1-like esterase
MGWNNKKRIGWFIVLLIYPCALYAQAVWDSTVRPAVYGARVEQFKSFEHSKKDIIFLGNSITFWGEWSELLNTPNIKNRGIPGDNTFGVLERLDEIIKGKPAKIFILIGINDLAGNTPDSIILKNYKRIIHQIQSGSPSSKIYFQTMLPTNDSFHTMTNHCNKDTHIRRINTALREMSAKEKIVLIDLYSNFADENGKLKKEYTWDGVHLTIAGYIQWVKVLKNGRYLK